MLNENLKRLRKEKGLSQEELAEQIHVVRQTVSKWEKGLSFPDSEMLVKLAAALDTTVGALIGETTEVEPSNESESESSEPPASQKKKKRIILTSVIAASAVIVVSVVLLVCMAMGLFTAKSPLEKTIEAVFPDIDLWENIAHSGGSISLQGRLDSDLGEKITDQPILLNAKVVLGEKGLLFAVDAGTEQEKMDLSLIVDSEGTQIVSDRLLSGGYSVAFEGLMGAIDQSIFAPNSGTDYAIPQEMYDALRKYMESSKEEEELPSLVETEKVVRAMLDAAMQEATVTEEKKSIILADGAQELTLRVMCFDSKALRAATDVLFDEWKNNTAFHEELLSFMDAYMELYVMDGQEESLEAEEALKSFKDQLKSNVDAIIKNWKDTAYELKITYALNDGYVVYMEAEAKQELPVGKGTSKMTSVSHLDWKFSSDPGKDRSYIITMSATVDEQKTELFTFSYRQEGKTRFSLHVDIAKELSGSDEIALTLKGEHRTSRRKAEVILDGVDLKQGEESLLAVSKSKLALTIQSGAKEVKRHSSNTDLLSIKAADMDVLFDTIEQNFLQFKNDLNRSVGYDLIYEKAAHRIQAQTAFENIYDYAYDAKTGHLFVAVMELPPNQNYQYYIKMYDTKTMTELKKIQVGGMVLMDADNGYLVYGLRSVVNPGMDFEVVVLDAKNMQNIKTMPLNGMSGIEDQHLYCEEIILDGTTLTCLTGEGKRQLIFLDINEQDVIGITELYSAPEIAIDRPNHVIGIVENNSTECTFSLYDSKTGAWVWTADVKKYLPYSVPFAFDGTSFYCFGNHHYSADGTLTYTEDILALRQPFDDFDKGDELLYWDENIIVTKENDENSGEQPTVMYERGKDGSLAKMFDVVDLTSYQSITRIGENEYLALSLYRYQYVSIEYFTVEPSYAIDFGK
ncbi:MAG: helix-turn-helix transcriptional regulator [Ruminococcaceae bacterium]|nr:helix-turn-helix transcriptional regulator [Oscillospiraceae bacterium]